MTSFPPPTWAMWTTSWSEMIWIPIWSQQDQSHVSCCNSWDKQKKSLWDYPPLLTLTCKGRLQTCSIDKEVQRLHEYSWPMSTSIMFFVDLSKLFQQQPLPDFINVSWNNPLLHLWSRPEASWSILSQIYTSKQPVLSKNQPVISNSSPRASRPATCAFVQGAASWWRKCWLWPCPAGWNHCKTYFFICSHGCHAVVVCWATKCLGQNHQQHDFGTALHCNHWSSTRKPLIEESQRMPMSNTRLSWSHHREFCCLRSRFNLLWDTRKKHASRMPKWMHASNPLEFFVKRVLSHDTLPILLPQVQP